LLKQFIVFIKSNKKFNSDLLKSFLEEMVDLAEKSETATEWSANINKAVKNYKINED
jgi:hypothetical protein